MKSTIRFNSDNSYNCKQTNIISSTDITSIEQVNGNNVLVSQSNINIDFDTDNKDVNFTMTVKNIVKDVSSISDIVDIRIGDIVYESN